MSTSSTSMPLAFRAEPTIRASGLAPAITKPLAVGLARSSARASGRAVRPYTTTVPTITASVMGRMTWASGRVSARRSAKMLDTAAATIPRGAIHARNNRSFHFSGEAKVETSTAAGRTTRISALMNSRLRHPNMPIWSTVTRAASTINSTAISRLVRCSLNSATWVMETMR